MLTPKPSLRNFSACLVTFTLSIWSSTSTAETSQLAVLGACAALQGDGLLLPVGLGGLPHIHVYLHPAPVLDDLGAYLAALKYNSPEQKLAQEKEIIKGVTEAHEISPTDADCADALVSVHGEYCAFLQMPLWRQAGESCDPRDLTWGEHHRNGKLLMRALDLKKLLLDRSDNR